jgi:hypothetical protein
MDEGPSLTVITPVLYAGHDAVAEVVSVIEAATNPKIEATATRTA